MESYHTLRLSKSFRIISFYFLRKEDQPFGRDLIPKRSVAYLRVGTMRQNLLGLGLDGQKLEPKTFDLLFSAVFTAPSLTSNLIGRFIPFHLFSLWD